MTEPSTLSRWERLFADDFETVPVWFMRQAGRFLPSYRRLRERYSLETLFYEVDLAAEVTLLPIRDLEVDCAILFADILSLPRWVGFDIHFHPERGPLVNNPLRPGRAWDRFEECPFLRSLVTQIRCRLPETVPLIGFAGGPFTVLSYLIEGKGALSWPTVVDVMSRDPELFDYWLNKWADETDRYLAVQEEAGVDAVQVFDSWVGSVPRSLFRRHLLPGLKRIFANRRVPTIYFSKYSRHLSPDLFEVGADFYSLGSDWELSDPQVQAWAHRKGFGAQGNLWPGWTLNFSPRLDEEIRTMVQAGRKWPRYIFNLSHGLLPNSSVDIVRRIRDRVRVWGKEYRA